MTAQAPMISSPLKQTNEIDWIAPLKGYIRQTYGDDPERYAEECATLNRLRQDMRGAGKDSAAGRDLLYRYYGQLELLDLRFPVDENHIKISFTWFDAFTHKPTSQYSLAYEKASIIFNISAVLSCHAANQNRSEEAGLKTAYHSFQASAGMFTYINENFLHAPSTDLSRDTVKTLIAIMLAQAQEVFLEKQISDDKKVGLLAKLASQAGYLYSQAAEGVQENVARGIFERVWLLMTQIKANYMNSLAQYYQAIADDDANSHGVAISRLQVAEAQGKDANRLANGFPQSLSSTSNITSDAAAILIEMTKRHLTRVQQKFTEFSKDNDFIYHQIVPAEASLPVIPKLPAAKAIPVSELYQGQDIQKIIGPDIFQKIVPMAVTESASLYDEEKAKLIRAEGERVDLANGELAASLDYLKLPGSLQILKGGLDQQPMVDDEFRSWCEEVAGHESFGKAFQQIQSQREEIIRTLDKCTKQLDMEESVCEKMRSKYGADWTQQPSSRLTATLRNDIRSYRGAIDEASTSDSQLSATLRQHERDFDEMRSAGETDEADVLFQRALVKIGASRAQGRNGVGSPLSSGAVEGNLLDEDYGEGGVSVMDQIARIEDLLKKLNLIKRERTQVLMDLKEKIHNDDISQVLILNKKSLSNQDNQLFQTELEKFRPHQNRILQANHKQSSLMKELTVAYNELLQDKRVRAEQSKYESFTRQRNSVLSRYRKVFQAFQDLEAGLTSAQGFYSGMRDTVDSLEKNVDTFVNNRRSEGAQLLNQIERDKSESAGSQADRERERLKELMERMSIGAQTSASSPKSQTPRPQAVPMASYGSAQQVSSPPGTPGYPSSNAYPSAQLPPSQDQSKFAQYQPYQSFHQPQGNDSYSQAPPQAYEMYDPSSYGRRESYQTSLGSPPPQQQFSPPGQYGYVQGTRQQYMPPGYVPPPPPPGPPPSYGGSGGPYPSGAGGFTQGTPSRSGQQSTQGDPWAGLNAWK